ncbi:MAG: hypothetical protein NZ888_04150 [Candidatus Nitrosocaldus sp.]|nr:hypothetical protein [Candidatus Nitrosocaldus sp.]MDW8000985.1 hypothetical protein [Candidatus Nitrosocaldus sp.]
MYSFAFSLWDIGLWLAVSSIIMLITSELLAPYYSRAKTVLDVKRLRIIAVGSGLAFIVIAMIRISAIIG